MLLVFIPILIKKIFYAKKVDKKQLYKNYLEKLDFKDQKQDAYKATKYIRFLAKSKEQKELAKEIIDSLEQYKYTKNPPPFDPKIKSLIELFIHLLF